MIGGGVVSVQGCWDWNGCLPVCVPLLGTWMQELAK
jgi:hypothetical protein